MLSNLLIKMNKYNILNLLVILALAGCSLAPTYERPALPVPDEWPAPASIDPQTLEEKQIAEKTPVEENKPLQSLKWEDFFVDERLKALIAAALENNRDMRIATARIEEARAQYGIVFSDRFPKLDGSISETRSRSSEDFAQPGMPIVSKRYDVAVNMTGFELDFWGRVHNLSSAAKSMYLSTEEAQRAFKLSLISDVANAYFNLLELEERVKLTEDTRTAREESHRLTESRFKNGLASKLDMLQAEGILQNLRAEQANLKRQYVAAQNLLDFLVGTRPADLPAAVPLKEMQATADLQPELPSKILVNRPDILAAEQRLIAANANIGAARAAFFPRVTLNASAGTASRELERLFDMGTHTWSFTPLISIPIFSMGQQTNTVALAHARKNIAVNEYERAIQQAFREVADALAARTLLTEQLTAQEAARDAQEERLRLTDARYKTGLASYFEVLDAQREFYTAEQAAVQIKRQVFGNSVQLYKALGGGLGYRSITESSDDARKE
jgi:multidrug efflux system outer membrane protein